MSSTSASSRSYQSFSNESQKPESEPEFQFRQQQQSCDSKNVDAAKSGDNRSQQSDETIDSVSTQKPSHFPNKQPQPILYASNGSCTLIPYERIHVPIYHSWMSTPELLNATASEPLTLEEEYANQISWKQDPTKYTYIILDNSLCDLLPSGSAEITKERQTKLEESLELENEGEKYICAMAGDVNLFLHDYLEDEGELEIMIANPLSRHKGLAIESLKLLMQYSKEYLNIHKFVAKISKGNQASLSLFQKYLHFRIREYVDVFEEYELESTT